ncbi:MAG TPA: hypothetical protein ENJ54_03165, partial [Chloroflexi bacterium]|nr:hypothetical protein [Chloroflexota bacterium]
MHYAEIAVHEPKIQGVFHYHIPPELAEAVQPGAVVVVPFGQRQVYGVVLRLLPTPAVPETKPVLSVPAPEVALTPLQLRLAEQIAADTLASLSACIALMLPPGVLQAADTRYHLTAEAPAADALPPDLHETERRLLALLHTRGPLRGRQFDRALPRHNWRAAAARLQRRGWLESEPVLPKPHLPRNTVRMARLAVPQAEALGLPLEHLSRREATARRRRKVLEALAAQSPREVAALRAETDARPGDLEALARLGLVERYTETRRRAPLADLTEPPPPGPPP